MIELIISATARCISISSSVPTHSHGRRGVAKNPHNLVLRQQPAIVQGKQERLAD